MSRATSYEIVFLVFPHQTFDVQKTELAAAAVLVKTALRNNRNVKWKCLNLKLFCSALASRGSAHKWRQLLEHDGSLFDDTTDEYLISDAARARKHLSCDISWRGRPRHSFNHLNSNFQHEKDSKANTSSRVVVVLSFERASENKKKINGEEMLSSSRCSMFYY